MGNKLVSVFSLSIPLIFCGCGEHSTAAEAKQMISRIESYKVSMVRTESCNERIEGADAIVDEARSLYRSEAFKNYLNSATRELARAEKTCERYEKFRDDAASDSETLDKLNNAVSQSIAGALNVVSNGITQQEAYKPIEKS